MRFIAPLFKWVGVAVLAALALFHFMPRMMFAPIPPEVVAKSESVEKVSFHSSIFQKILEKRRNRSTLPKNKKAKTESASSKQVEKALKSWGKKGAESTQYLQKAIELDPNNAKALGLMAGLLLNEGKIPEAREMAIDCLATDPKESECHTTLISSFTRKGEFEDAYYYLSDCLSDDPENIHCISAMENYYLNLERLPEAKEMLEKLNRLAPDNKWTVLARASYSEKSGNLPSATTNYALACKLGVAYACHWKKH